MPYDGLAQYDLAENKADRVSFLADFIERNVPEKELRMDAYHCGTAHCAYGWAERLPEFKLLGIPSSSSFHYDEQRTAAIEFFGLTRVEWSYCFGPSRLSKTKIVNRLRTVAKTIASLEVANAPS